jgi:iron complex transport system ATP-binding protein
VTGEDGPLAPPAPLPPAAAGGRDETARGTDLGPRVTPSLAAEAVELTVGKRRILDGVTLAAGGGEIVALVGPNGAGKSSLLRVLAGDASPTAGRVLIDGRPIGDYRSRELARRRAVLPQQTVLPFAFTVREVVEMGRFARRGEDDPAAIDRALTATEAVHLADQVFSTLSLGEQARVSLARVLAQEAPILLLDEPTAALDLRHQGIVMALARRMAHDGGISVVVLHDLNLAATWADRIVLIAEGALVADGRPAEVLTGDLLSRVYACPVAVVPHPVHGGPLILPFPGGAGGPG